MYQATDKDRDLTKQIIREAYKEIKQELTDEVLDSKVDEILNISYSIGAGYDQNTLRKITQSMLKRDIL